MRLTMEAQGGGDGWWAFGASPCGDGATTVRRPCVESVYAALYATPVCRQILSVGGGCHDIQTVFLVVSWRFVHLITVMLAFSYLQNGLKRSTRQACAFIAARPFARPLTLVPAAWHGSASTRGPLAFQKRSFLLKWPAYGRRKHSMYMVWLRVMVIYRKKRYLIKPLPNHKGALAFLQ